MNKYFEKFDNNIVSCILRTLDDDIYGVLQLHNLDSHKYCYLEKKLFKNSLKKLIMLSILILLICICIVVYCGSNKC